jgi:hypothetical protein
MPVNTSSPSVETQARRLLTTRGEGSDWRMDGSSVALWQVDQHACCAHGRTVESLVLPWLNRSVPLMRPRGGGGAGQQMRPAHRQQLGTAGWAADAARSSASTLSTVGQAADRPVISAPRHPPDGKGAGRSPDIAFRYMRRPALYPLWWSPAA